MDDERTHEEAAQSYSGRFVVRIPPSLHRDVVRAAQREGVSLNQFAAVALARAVGYGDRAEENKDDGRVRSRVGAGGCAAEGAPAAGDSDGSPCAHKRRGGSAAGHSGAAARSATG